MREGIAPEIVWSLKSVTVSAINPAVTRDIHARAREFALGIHIDSPTPTVRAENNLKYLTLLRT